MPEEVVHRDRSDKQRRMGLYNPCSSGRLIQTRKSLGGGVKFTQLKDLKGVPDCQLIKKISGHSIRLGGTRLKQKGRT